MATAHAISDLVGALAPGLHRLTFAIEGKAGHVKNWL
jgi:hypothetical protein